MQSAPALLRQFVGSKSLLPVLGADVMPGIAFPRSGECYRGSLGPRFPTPPTRPIARHCPAVLCVATTAFVHPGRSAFGSLPVPWSDALLFVFLPACAGFGSSAGRVARQMPGCCLSRSPAFRLLLPRRREALPSSRITLLPTCPALRPRWCPARLPWREQACCLPFGAGGRLWVRLPELILSPRLYIFRSSMTRPVFSPYLCFAHRFSAIALRFGCRPGG